MSPSTLSWNDLRRIFTTIDIDGDGLLTVGELQLWLQRIGIPASAWEVDGVVGTARGMDLKEFICYYETSLSTCSGGSRTSTTDESDDGVDDDEDLLAAFKVFDLNDDGFISSSELQSVLSKLGLWEEARGGDCASMIRNFDTNFDGVLDFQEFKNMMLFSIA